jgi:hypothetical protein
MSAMRHPTISAWHREEDGSYAAELHGFHLRVRWHPERAHHPRGFSWIARKGAQKHVDRDIYEEIELGMVAAEMHAEAASTPKPHADDGEDDPPHH